MGRRVQLAAGPTSSAISTIVGTAAKFDPEPISKAILAAVAGIVQFFNFGYDPQKLNDTAVTEALIIGFNQAWDQLTGEALPYNCSPGQCGSQHVAIFTRSAWPNVPMPGGYAGADIAGLITAFENAIATGQSKLERPQSLSDFQANANYVMTLLNQAYQYQQQQLAASGPLSSLTSALGGGTLAKILPWALGALVLYEVV